MRSIAKLDKFITRFLLVLLIAILFGCNTSDDDEDTSNNEITISVALSGSQSVPMQTSSASGSGSMTIDTDTGDVSGSVEISNLSTGNSVSAVHLHSGAPGDTGGIVITLEQDSANSATWNIPASSVLSMDQLEALLAGETYLNVHTSDVASGEIRGQVLPNDYEIIVTTLSGDQQAPSPVTSSLTATAFTLMNTNNGMLKTRLHVSDASDVTAVHIHEGVAGTNGAPVVTLVQDASDMTIYEIETELTATHQTAYAAGELYFNLHTSANAAGEIRGQLLPENIEMVRSTLDSSQVTENVTSNATGIAYITVNQNTGATKANIQLSDISDVNLVHIHEGASGATGGVVLTFSSSETDVWSVTDTLDADALTKFNAGELYYNVHTTMFASGEIRGQIEP